MAHLKELKLKSRIHDIEKAREDVEKIASFVREDEITDFFFDKDESGSSELRLRKLENDRIVTLKIPSGSKDGVQYNDEYRFGVDHADEFVSFLEKMRFKPRYRIRKKSSLYRCGDIEIELSNIDQLGNFMELKTHADVKSSEERRLKLLSLARKLKLKGTELRYFSAMLRDKEKNPNG